MSAKLAKKTVKKEIKSVLNHAFEGSSGVSRDEWIAAYDKFLAEFNSTDKDGSGKIDRDEWIEKYGNDDCFDAYDLNGDGGMDAEEFAHARATEGKLKELDADGDGKISREEWIAMYGNATGYDAYDLDGDGMVDANEFRKAHSAEFEFGRLDKDGDGVVSLEEWIEKYGSADGFYEMDLDGDGVIDASEFRTVKTKQMEDRHFAAEADRDVEIRRDEWVERYGNENAFVPGRKNGCIPGMPANPSMVAAAAAANSNSWRHLPAPCEQQAARCTAAERLRMLQLQNSQLMKQWVDPGHVLARHFPGHPRPYTEVAHDPDVSARMGGLNRVYSHDGRLPAQVATRGFVRPYSEVILTKSAAERGPRHPLF